MPRKKTPRPSILPEMTAPRGKLAPRPVSATPLPAKPLPAPGISPPPEPHPVQAHPVGAAPHGAAPNLTLGSLQPLTARGPGKASASGTRSGVAVIGSLHMELIVRIETMPLPGQTVQGQDPQQKPGGKGGNQALAIGRLWPHRTPGGKLIARIGDDIYGQNILAALRQAKVDTQAVLTTRHTPTGTALILVDRHGEQAQVIAGGANRHLSATDLLAQRKTIENARVLLAQLEIPADTVACGIALAKRSNVLTILDPSPAPSEGLPESLYHVDILTPNQNTAHLLTGVPVRTLDDARRAAEKFLQRGTRLVVLPMGAQGAVIVHRENPAATTVTLHVPGFRVAADAASAGDVFTGALAMGLAEGMALPEAVRLANAAYAVACAKAGAPTRAEVESLLNPPPRP